MLLDMWGAVSAQWWAEKQAALGLTGQVANEAHVGIMVSTVWLMLLVITSDSALSMQKAVLETNVECV